MSFIYPEVNEFRVKEKLFSLTGDAFKIQRESTKEEVFKVEPKLISLSGKKKLKDMNGNVLFMMKEKLISFHDRMYIDNADGKTVYTLRKKSMVPVMGRRTVYVWKGDDDEGEPWIEVHGNLIKKNFKVNEVQNNKEVATISRQLINVQSVLLDNDSYVVRVNPGYNAAFIVFLAVAIDEQYHD